MYKLLLAWRYLRTRYIALASIISVTLGVATLVVVNSVMAGFSAEMHKRLHGILSDIVFESHNLDGFPDPEWHAEQIRKVVGDDLAGLTPVVHVPALLRMKVRGQYHTRQIRLIGIDADTYARVSDFGQYLLHPENRQKLSFLLRESGYAPGREGFPVSGWGHRRARVSYEMALLQQWQQSQADLAETPSTAMPQAEMDEESAVPDDPYLRADASEQEHIFDPMTEQHDGLIMGIAIGTLRARDMDGLVRDYYLCQPGDDVEVIVPNAGGAPRPVNAFYTVVDLYESKMSEYDSNFAFVPLASLQNLRGMMDSVTSIQIRLKPGADLNEVRDRLRAAFPPDVAPYRIQTWRDLQGPLLAAVRLETAILNVLLFLIIAVAGFGILATFFMIVVEKTRDIGILKALGAPSGGVMSIFLSYGISLGAVGAGVGIVIGLLFVSNINTIAGWVEVITGEPVFDPTVYYFQEIPTNVEPTMVVGVMLGALLIAVMASVLPAIRAARFHPVQALRYE